MRLAAISVAIVTTLTAMAFGAGAATAAEPVAQPDRVGVQLNHDETTALAGGPLPALVTMAVPVNRIGAGLKGDTDIFRDENGGVHASLRQVIMEAAAHPDGTVTLYLNAPGTRNDRMLDIFQNWN